MVDAEEHRPRARYPFEMPDLDALEENQIQNRAITLTTA
jgi:hypothetical protein